MSNARNIASGAKFVDTAGDTMTGVLTLNNDIIANKHLRLYTTDDQANQWYVYNNTDDTLRFNYNGAGNDEVVLDTVGRMKIPNQPYGKSSCNTGETATGKIQLTGNMQSRGGMQISSTDDRMTVPVAGGYLIGYHHLGENAGTQVEIRINGSGQSGSRTQSPNSNSGSNLSISSAIIRNLSANDYIEWWCVAGKTHGNDYYNSMYVIYLG